MPSIGWPLYIGYTVRSWLMTREQVMKRHLVFILGLLVFFVAARDGMPAQIGESKLSALDSLSGRRATGSSSPRCSR